MHLRGMTAGEFFYLFCFMNNNFKRKLFSSTEKNLQIFPSCEAPGTTKWPNNRKVSRRCFTVLASLVYGTGTVSYMARHLRWGFQQLYEDFLKLERLPFPMHNLMPLQTAVKFLSYFLSLDKILLTSNTNTEPNISLRGSCPKGRKGKGKDEVKPSRTHFDFPSFLPRPTTQASQIYTRKLFS